MNFPFLLEIMTLKIKDENELTHIGKLSGNDSGDFPETFSKKNILLYCDVTTDDN